MFEKEKERTQRKDFIFVSARVSRGGRAEGRRGSWGGKSRDAVGACHAPGRGQL